MKPPELSVLIPVHNEAPSVGRVVRRLLETGETAGAALEVIVIDDGSSDDSAAQAAGAGARVIRHAHNRGYGAALKTGLAAAHGPLVAIIDGDGTYDAAELTKLLAAVDESDMVVGVRRGRVGVRGVFRSLGRWILRKLANYLTGVAIPDLNSGFRLFGREDARGLLPILPNGFSFTTTLTLAYLCRGRSVRYVAIDYRRREHGRSAIRPIRDLGNFIALILRTVLYFNPLKIFLPLSAVVFLAGLIVFFVTKAVGRVMDITVTALLVTSVQVFVIGLLADLIVRRSS